MPLLIFVPINVKGTLSNNQMNLSTKKFVSSLTLASILQNLCLCITVKSKMIECR
jgi:hypothetical protein